MVTKCNNNPKGIHLLKFLLFHLFLLVTWRLRYEIVDVPYTQPEWLKDLVLDNKNDKSHFQDTFMGKFSAVYFS